MITMDDQYLHYLQRWQLTWHRGLSRGHNERHPILLLQPKGKKQDLRFSVGR
jgi:hypothetical protein